MKRVTNGSLVLTFVGRCLLLKNVVLDREKRNVKNIANRVVGQDVQFLVIFLIQSLSVRCLGQLIDELSILGCLVLLRSPIETITSATQKASKHYSSLQHSTATEQDHSLPPCNKQTRRMNAPVVPFLVSIHHVCFQGYHLAPKGGVELRFSCHCRHVHKWRWTNAPSRTWQACPAACFPGHSRRVDSRRSTTLPWCSSVRLQRPFCRKLQSLLVCTIILWRVFHWGGLNLWLTVQTRISDLDLVLAFHFSPLWMNGVALRAMNSTGAILADKVLMMTHLDCKKTFPDIPCVFQMLGVFSAARRCERMSQHPCRYPMRWEWHSSTVTWEFPLRIDSASWKSLESLMQCTSFWKIVFWSSMNFRLAIVPSELRNFRNSSISVDFVDDLHENPCWRHNSSRRSRRSSSAWAAWNSLTKFLAIFRDNHLVFVHQRRSWSVRLSCFAHQVSLIHRPLSQLGCFQKSCCEHCTCFSSHQNQLTDRHFFLPQVSLIHRPQQTTTTDWLTRIVVRSNRLVLGLPRWATCRVTRHPCPGPMTGQCMRMNPMNRWARWRSWSCAHNLWGRWRRRRRRHSPCWRSSTVAQAFHDDQVVELRVQLGMQEVEGKKEDREGQVEVEEERRLKRVRSWWLWRCFWQDSDLEPMRCKTTWTVVPECALCASSAYDVHHASVCVNAVVLCELHVIVRVHVISLVVHAVIGLTLGLIAHVVVVVVFVVAMLHRIFCIWRYTFYNSIAPSSFRSRWPWRRRVVSFFDTS